VEPEISTNPSRLHKFGRWLVIVFSAANLLVAVAVLALMWSTIANPGTPLLRINDSVSFVGWLLFAAVIFLIAWNAGNQPANLALALALALLSFGPLFDKLLEQLPSPFIRSRIEWNMGYGVSGCLSPPQERRPVHWVLMNHLDREQTKLRDGTNRGLSVCLGLFAYEHHS